MNHLVLPVSMRHVDNPLQRFRTAVIEKTTELEVSQIAHKVELSKLSI